MSRDRLEETAPPDRAARWPLSRIAGLVALGLVIGLPVWFVAEVVRKIDQRARRMDVPNDLKAIGVARHEHHVTHGEFPAAFARSRSARPPVSDLEFTNRLSWRYDLLPFVGQRDLFNRMTPNEPWDGPTNRRYAETPVAPYTDPDARTGPATRWRVFYGPQTLFPPDGRLRDSSISDGTANTIFVIETRDKVTWSRFGEVPFDPNAGPDPASFGREKFDFFHVLMFDGSVRQVRKSVSPATLRAAITPAGGDLHGSDW